MGERALEYIERNGRITLVGDLLVILTNLDETLDYEDRVVVSVNPL